MSYLCHLIQSHKKIDKAIKIDKNHELIKLQEEIELLRLEVVNAKCETKLNNAILCFEEINITLGDIFSNIRETEYETDDGVRDNIDIKCKESILRTDVISKDDITNAEFRKADANPNDIVNVDEQMSHDYKEPQCDNKLDNTKLQPVGDSFPLYDTRTTGHTNGKATQKTKEPHDEETTANVAKFYPIVEKYYFTNADSLIIKQGLNPKVIQVVDKTKYETAYILNDKKYLPNEKLPRKLTQRITKFGSIIESKLRTSLNEIQQVNKEKAMGFIYDINRYLKVFRVWKENTNGENFYKLE